MIPVMTNGIKYSKAELEENKKRGGGGTIHFMDEIPEYKEIYEKHREEDEKLEKYREECKDEAIDMLKEFFFPCGIDICKFRECDV